VKVSQLDLKKQHIIEQLNKLGIKDTQGCTYNELKRRLAVARYLEVDVKGNQWF
jgi:hypothetical protein